MPRPQPIRRLAALAAIGLLAVVSRADDLERVRSYLTGPGADLPAGLVIEATVRTESTRDRATVDRRVQELASRPDHPDAATWSHHQALLARPVHRSLVVAFDGPSDWAWRRTEGESAIHAAGTGPVRWQFFERPGGGQLTLTRSGVPFPAAYNVGLWKDQAARVRDLVLMVPPVAGPTAVTALTATGDGWQALVEADGRSYRLDGAWRDGDPVLTAMVTLAGNPPEPTGERVTFSGHRRADRIGRWVSEAVTVQRPDDVRERYEVVSIDAGDRARVAELTQVPSVDDGVAVQDFRSPSSEAHAAHHSQPSITWAHADDADTYDLSELELGAVSSAAPADAAPRSGRTGVVIAVVVIAALLACGLALRGRI